MDDQFCFENGFAVDINRSVHGFMAERVTIKRVTFSPTCPVTFFFKR
jgi:hypothetical protein